VRTSKLIALLAIASVSAACAARNAQLASDTSGAEDVNGTESDVESLGTSFIGSDGQSVATQSLAVGGDIKPMDLTTVGNAGFYFIPSGCLQVTSDTAKQSVAYVFSGCTGPLGLVELTGTVNVTWQLSGDQLTLNYSAQSFQINRATIDSWQATAVITSTGSQRSMTWNAQLSGTTGNGRTFNRTNQKNLQWTVGVECVSATGQSTGDILGADLQTTITSWQRCADSCPQAGSAIAVKDLDNGDTIDVDYLGGDRADLTLNGRSFEIGLACGL
jgi:hypothetical protein